jgi:hypothetical protein
MFVLKERLQDKEDGKGAGGGAADDAPTVQAGPGETAESLKTLDGADRGDAVKADDKVDDKADDKAAKGSAKDDDKDDKKAAGADDKSDDKSDDDIGGIPKSRLDAVLERARTAEKENRELRAQQTAAPAAAPAATDDDDSLTIAQAEKRVADLDLEIATAMKDEEDESGAKLAVLIREQRELGQGIQEAKMEDAQVDNRAQTSEEIQFDRVVNELESQIPQLDPHHDEYSEEMVGEVITLAQALNQQGRTQADSMLLAVDYMSGKLGISKQDMASVKKETDVAKNVDTAKKLPPDLSEAKGMSSDKAGVTRETGKVANMSEDEFYTLSEDEERIKFLRGDTL